MESIFENKTLLFGLTALGVLLAYFTLKNRSSSANVSKISVGNSQDTLALASLQSQSISQDQSQRFDLIKSIFGFQSIKLGLESNERIQNLTLAEQERLANAAYAAQLQQTAMQVDAAKYIAKKNHSSTIQGILGSIFGGNGISSILGMFL